MPETIAITRLTLREIRLALREPFRISSGLVTTRRILLLELVDRDGVTAWSECVAGERPNYSPETIDTAWLAISEWVAPRVLGHEFAGPQEVDAALRRDFRGHNMAKAALEMGAWALAAERRAVSLMAVLGGTRAKVATGISLGIQPDPESLVAVARDALAQGYRKIKCKIAPGADVEYIAAVRYTLDDAAHLAKLDEFDLLMIEQPLAADDLVRHAELQKKLATPICLDESITGVERAADALTLGSGRIINIKPGRVGGFAQAKAIHDLCAEAAVPVWHGGMLESGIGRAYNVALASLPNFTIPGDLSPSARYWERDIVTPEWTMTEDGLVAVPFHRPGLGVAVDIDSVDDLTVRRQTLTAE
jgi:O-succinylbenzoate synthase